MFLIITLIGVWLIQLFFVNTGLVNYFSTWSIYLTFGLFSFSTRTILLVILAIVFIAAGYLYFTGKYKVILQWIRRLKGPLDTVLYLTGINHDLDEGSLKDSFEIAGYSYDEKQDVFYSVTEPWQKKFGYCKLYDEATIALNMVVDCEPVYFDYQGKKWMIEFWKGQYALPSGCEIGIYNTKGPDLNIPGFFNGTFYKCADINEYLWMSCTLKKNGKKLFYRAQNHWWLTGFKLGEFCEPHELSMDITITFKDIEMRNAFIKGMQKVGYKQSEIIKFGKSISFVYDKPRNPQPAARNTQLEEFVQSANKKSCDLYNLLTKDCNTMEEKMKAVRQKSPELYKYILGFGRPTQLYKSFDTIKDFLSSKGED